MIMALPGDLSSVFLLLDGYNWQSLAKVMSLDVIVAQENYVPR